MTMANGASTQASGGKMKFKPTKSTGAVKPPIPTDKWTDSIIVKGKGKVVASQGKNNELGAPGIALTIQLGSPERDENEKFKGSQETLRFYFYDDESDGSMTRAANFTRVRLRALCEAVEIDYDDNYPTSIESEADLKPLIKALEGKRIPELWTSTRKYLAKSGEEVESAELAFKEPGGVANGSGDSEGEEEEEETPPPKKRGRR